MTNPLLVRGTKARSILLTAALLTGTVGFGLSSVPGIGSGTALAADAATTVPSATPAQTEAAATLRVTLNNLLREHVTTSLDVTRLLADNAPQAEIDAAESAQYENSDALSAAIGSIYGGAAQAQFSDLFRAHIVKSNSYAMAVGNGDDAAKQQALTELQSYLTQISTFFSAAIPGLPAQDVYGMLNEHEELINKSTEAYKNGDYVASYQLEREALKQISGAADALSGGIIATQPDKF